ncbi:MAG: hypothetical protein IKQ16_07160 [Lentisphaeria bacterium]|nr:hypothetical protein [Lentisphaeria bacterium]
MIQHERNLSKSGDKNYSAESPSNSAMASSNRGESPSNSAATLSNPAGSPGQSSPVSKKAYAAVLLIFVFAATIFYTAACSLTKSGPEAPTEEIQAPTEVKQATSEGKQTPSEVKQLPSEAELPVSDEPVAPVFVRPARFLTDVCLTRSGDLWVTAEAGGVFRLHDPDKDKEWEDMRAQPGFPKTDNCTAVCEDSLGRIWVGTASMGVQVYNGRTWRRYDRDTVLSGSHIHDLASSESGLTAVAHESGVSVYDSQTDSWRDFTALNGLPSGGVRGVCFGPGDKLHCAMETGGYLQIDIRARRSWRVSAPDSWGKERAAFYPLTIEGDGMSSNFCNAIAIGEAGQVCIAGLNGISFGKDRDFRFLQGRDLKDKIEYAYRKEQIAEELNPARKKSKSDSNGRVIYIGDDGEEEDEDEEDFEDEEEEEEIVVGYEEEDPGYGPLKESYVTSVYYGKNGLWIGYRTKGVELRAADDDPKQVILGIERRDPANPSLVEIVYSLPEIRRPVRGFVELPDGRVFAATYGTGLEKLCRGNAFEKPQTVPATAANHPSHTAADPVSVLQDFERYDMLPDERPEKNWAYYIGEDWVTKGDWPGRYGARRQILCAMNTRLSGRGGWDGGVHNEDISVGVMIGPHKNRSDSNRYWIDWEVADDRRDVLLQMEYGHRTQSEWNDNGEEYPRQFEGPDLWLTILKNPKEDYRLSLYFFNSNGRIGDNVERDYIIEVYASSQQETPADCMKKKPLCTARVADFASGGVYKSFVLCGSRSMDDGYWSPNPCYRVRLVRYGSLNVILNGVFLDRLFEPQDVRVIPEAERIAEQGNYRAPRWYDCGTDELTGTAKEFLDRYFSAPETSYGLASMPLLRLAFYRYVRENLPDNRNLAERLRWDACIWTDADRAEFDAAMQEYWAEVLKEHPERAERK